MNLKKENEILNQVSVFASDFARASTDRKASPDRQDDGLKLDSR